MYIAGTEIRQCIDMSYNYIPQKVVFKSLFVQVDSHVHTEEGNAIRVNYSQSDQLK